MKKLNLSRLGVAAEKLHLARMTAVGGVAAFVASSARAEIDTAPITAALTEAGTAAGVVGAAVLVVLIGIKAFKYVRAAM